MNLFYYAPHWNSLFPDGAGHRADFIYKALTKIKNFNSSILQTKNFIAFFENGNPRNFCKLPCFQTKIFFALVSLIFHFHYVETKHINFLNNIGTYLFFFFKPCNFFYIHFLNKIEECNAIIGQQQMEIINATIYLILNKGHAEKLESMKRQNIMKCISWCDKHGIPCNKIIQQNNIFLKHWNETNIGPICSFVTINASIII